MRRFPNETPAQFFNRELLRERMRDETRIAKDYQRQHPDIPWGEALRLAKKHLDQDARRTL